MAENVGERATARGAAKEPTMTAMIKEDEVVARLVQDPNCPPDLLLFWGYGGRSPAEGYGRLYLDASCSHFVDIPQGSIVHTVSVPPPQSPLGGSYVWVLKEHWIRLKWGSSAMMQPATVPSPLEWYQQQRKTPE